MWFCVSGFWVFEFWGLGCLVHWGLGFGFCCGDFGFLVMGFGLLGFGIWVLGIWFKGFGFWGSWGFRLWALGLRALCFRVSEWCL